MGLFVRSPFGRGDNRGERFIECDAAADVTECDHARNPPTNYPGLSGILRDPVLRLGCRAGGTNLRWRGARRAAPTPAPQPKPPPGPKLPLRREALTLLAALQREARLVDFVQESLTGYNDAQIGAVARDIHRDCGALLERLFALRPAVTQQEGAEVEIPAGFDPNRWRLTGNVTGQPPFRGRLVHPGWEATICEVPTWSGDPAAARIVAPAEVELR